MQAQEDDVFVLNNIDEGLSNKWIYSMAQDELGFIWVGTEDGLNRYDGYTFNVLRNSPENSNSLPANLIMDIAITEDNNYWLATRGGGLSLFSPKTMEFKNYTRDYGTNFHFVSSIELFPNGGFAMVCDEGVFIYKKETDSFKNIKIGESRSNLAVLGNSLWVSKKNILYEYDLEKEKTISTHTMSENIVMLNNLQYGLLIGTTNKLIYFADQTFVKEIKLEEPLLHFVNKGSINYLASHKNLYQLDLKTFTLHKKNASFSSNPSIIKTLLIDNQDQLWVGTTNGLFKEKSLHRAFIEKPIPLHARRIIKQGTKLWVGGLRGLYAVNDTLQNKFLTGEILSLQIFDDVVWAGTPYGEIHRIKNDTLLPPLEIRDEKSNIQRISGIEQDKKKQIWIGSWNGIHVLNPDGSEKKFFKLKKGEAKIMQMLLDSKDRLWIVTAAYGVFLLPNLSDLNIEELDELPSINYVHDQNDLNSINSDIILTLDESNKGTIWFGSDIGVFGYNEDQNNFVRLRVGKDLFDKKIMAIRCDHQDNLWISTISDGIYKYDQTNETFSNYTIDDGLRSNDFLFSSGFFDPLNNELYFGSEKGIQRIHVNETIFLDKKNAPIISDFIIQNKSTSKPLVAFASPYIKELNLSHLENDFSVRFSNLDHKFSKKINYLYALNNTEWRTTDNQTAYFSNIPYGTHSLKVKADYNFGNSDAEEEITTITLKITPPWYMTWWAYSLYTLLGCLILFIIYYLLLKQRLALEASKITIEFDQVKSRMYANISHEFRTPLTIINGLSDSLIDLKAVTPKNENKLTGIKQSSNQLLHLVNQMLDLVSLDSQKLDTTYKNGDFVEFVKECISFYKSYAISKQQKIIFNSEVDHLTMDIDDDKLQKIINNIVSNAIKFTPPQGTIIISIHLSEEKKNAILKISDSGKGISQEHLPQIFDRYFMTFDNENNIGNGIGMALTKELTELLNGTIQVESVLGKGSAFTLILPITNKVTTLQTLEYKLPFTDEINDYFDDDDSQNHEKKYSILLVEDNKRVRDYLNELLSDQYHIHLAHNGKKGLEIAKSKKVDFIISDVMMPVMNGFEFCKHIKSQLETSHLPFIMITAKVEINDKLKGYKLGVDAYLNKPFNNQELLAIIENLINKKKQQVDYYKKLLKLPDNTKNYNQLDVDFINKIQQIALNKNLKLSADDISKELFTSRTQLHRKIKALTGMSITEYFNHIRVEKAKELLESTNLTISEIAYEIGYQDISYFSKTFKKAYDISPSMYRKNNS